MAEPQPVEMLKRILENYETEIKPLLDAKEYPTAAIFLGNYVLAYKRMLRDLKSSHPYILSLDVHLGMLKTACEKFPDTIEMVRDEIERDMGAIDIYIQK